MLRRGRESRQISLNFVITSCSSDLAEKYDPSRINRFVIDLASAFHRFYGSCRIQGADPAVQQARLALCIGVKNAIFNVLTMFKINVPEKM